MILPGHNERKEELMEAAVAIKGRSLWDDAFARLMRNKAAVASMIVLAVLVLVAFFGPLFWPHDYDTIYRDRVNIGPSMTPFHPMGTDMQGRDIAVRLMYGMQVSMLVGVVATLVSLLIGVTWGAIAGYVGGRTDHIMMRIVDIIYSMPYIFFVIILLALFREATRGNPLMNMLLIFAAIGAVEWLTMSRIVRGQTLTLRKREFVEAAEAAGVKTGAIIRRHILPNVIGPVVVYVTLTIPIVILAESFLSFLGLGVQEPLTSLGRLIKNGADNMETAWWSLVYPALAMMLTLLCFNFIGDGLRDAIDPKDR